ncbi:MAG: ATP-binding protein [Planctomycetota bacterium]
MPDERPNDPDLRARLERSERLAREVGALAGGLVHEIRNPLNALRIHLDLLREDLATDAPPTEKTRRRVGTLSKEVGRIDEILEEFLRYARGFEPARVPGDLSGVVSETLDFLSPEAAESKVQIHRGFAEGLGPVPMDAALVRQAVVNVVRNAIQALPSGGDIFVRISRDGGSAFLDVSDTGPGIPSEALPRVFDAFFSTKRGGTGLGLPVTRRIVEAHGGEISVQSEAGKGTNFRIRLPLSP